MQKLLLVSVLVTTAMAGTAAAGRAKPKWCSKVTMVSGNLDSFLKKDDVRQGLKYVVDKKCEADSLSDEEWRAVEDAYAKLSARLGLSEDDWNDVVDWAVEKMTRNPYPTLTGDMQKKPWTQLEPIDQFGGLEYNGVVAGNVGGAVDMPYFVDALGPKLSEAARAGYIADCLKPGLKPTDKAVAWAMCQGDIDVFDAKKVFAEMHADTTHDGQDRIYIRLVADDVAHDLAGHAADVKKLIAKDPIYGQMFDIAKKERSGWKANPDVLALQVAMEDGLVRQSRKASEGCADKTMKAVLSSVSKIPAKSFQLHRTTDEEPNQYLWDLDSVIASGLLSEPDAYLAVNADVMCANMTDAEDMFVELEHAVGARWAGLRGPRTATQTRIFMAGLQPDDRDTSIAYPRIERMWFGGGRGGGKGAGAYGTVTKVAAKGAKVHVEFEKKKHQWYESFNCHDTNHVQGIRDNGEIIYESICKGSKLVTSMVGPDPVDLAVDQGKAIKPGMVADIRYGLVLAAWPNNKSDTPSIILGQPVK